VRDRKEQEQETARMLKSLGELRRAIRSWLIVRGIKNVYIVDPLAASGAAADVEKAIGLMRDQGGVQPAGKGLQGDHHSLAPRQEEECGEEPRRRRKKKQKSMRQVTARPGQAAARRPEKAARAATERRSEEAGRGQPRRALSEGSNALASNRGQFGMTA
jgi:hypothetical protein